MYSIIIQAFFLADFTFALGATIRTITHNLLRRHFVEDTFRFVTETFCDGDVWYGDVWSRRRFISAPFFLCLFHYYNLIFTSFGLIFPPSRSTSWSNMQSWLGILEELLKYNLSCLVITYCLVITNGNLTKRQLSINSWQFRENFSSLQLPSDHYKHSTGIPKWCCSGSGSATLLRNFQCLICYAIKCHVTNRKISLIFKLFRLFTSPTDLPWFSCGPTTWDHNVHCDPSCYWECPQ
jgi:hypothetical protein